MARSNKAEKQDWAEMLNVDGKAEDVTPENYYRLFRAFAMHHAKHKEDVGTTINPIDNPQPWGAWQSYFKTKKIKSVHMRSVGMIAAITFDRELPLILLDFFFQRASAAERHFNDKLNTFLISFSTLSLKSVFSCSLILRLKSDLT